MSRRLVDPNDTRSAMVRLLQDGRGSGDYVWVCYSAQWPTLFKAQRLGYLTDDSKLTETGKQFLEMERMKLTEQQGIHTLRLAWRGLPTRLVPVAFADEASQIFANVRDANGFGASDMKQGCGDLLDATGEVVGRVSYNGKIWQEKKQ